MQCFLHAWWQQCGNIRAATQRQIHNTNIPAATQSQIHNTNSPAATQHQIHNTNTPKPTKTAIYYAHSQPQNTQKAIDLDLESGHLPMSCDLKGPAGGMGLIHRSPCYCFMTDYIGQVTCTSRPTAYRGAAQLPSHVSYPQESPTINTFTGHKTGARRLLQNCQLPDGNSRDISSQIRNFSQDYYKYVPSTHNTILTN
jgi:hypothetical protein